MYNFDLSQLVNTLSIQTESYNSKAMERYIKRFVAKLGLNHSVDSYGNIYVTKTTTQPDFYPTMVCHIDTVHDINNDSIVKRQGDWLYSIDTITCKRTGIGGDDKVGVFITLACLQHFPDFKAVFFKDEEVGCVGSSHANFSFFDDSTLVLECDRRGMGDFVTSISGIKLADNALLDDIDSLLSIYKRKPCSGGMTDVQKIAQNTSIQCANVNCGYYAPHTDDEIVSIEDVIQTMNFCFDVFDATQGTQYTMERKAYPKYMNPHYRDYYYDWYNDYLINDLPEVDDNDEPATINACSKCDGSQLYIDNKSKTSYCYDCNAYLTQAL